MSKTIRTDKEWDKNAYQALLRDAIGGKTLTAFAKNSGVSASLLSLQLKDNQTKPALRSYLVKIADASEGRVSRAKLLDAAGYNYDSANDLTSQKSDLSARTPGTLDYSPIPGSKLAKMAIIDALCRSGLTWTINDSYMDYVLGEKINIEFEKRNSELNVEILNHDSIDHWCFYLVSQAFTSIEKGGITHLLAYSFYYLLQKNERSKHSFVTDSKAVYDYLSEMTFPALNLPLSVILYDQRDLSILGEHLIQTSTANQDTLPTLK